MKITLPDDVKQIIETLEQHGYEGYAVDGYQMTGISRLLRHRSKSRNCSYARSIPGSSTER